MKSAPTGCARRCDDMGIQSHPEGFTLLEMMVVVTMILIVASIGSPLYIRGKVHAREAVLHDHLYEAAEKLPQAVILRSRRRRRISHRLENTQSEILRCAQNDSEKAFFRSLLYPALPD